MAFAPPWLYPLNVFVVSEQGIYYFATHRFLWPLLKARLLPCLILSSMVLAALFTFTYLPQVALLAIFHGHLAFFNATFLVLGEGAVIVALLFEAFFVDETQVDVFDAVLLNEGFGDLVTPVRIMHEDASTPVKQLGKPTKAAQFSPFSFRLICEFVLFLPLNLVPVVGTPAFLVLTGRRAGPLFHWRYFKLLEISKKEKRAFIKRWRWSYTGYVQLQNVVVRNLLTCMRFGTVALILQLLPVLSMLFLLTTATGAALWAGKLEERRRQDEQQDDNEAQYTDNPV
ncbi:MAG: hypothetical protein M1833_002403 [Piccolia ochrophora]|nr:MAG: hypothetical protein M1833_002403 [Piccolia ochrophora]